MACWWREPEFGLVPGLAFLAAVAIRPHSNAPSIGRKGKRVAAGGAFVLLGCANCANGDCRVAASLMTAFGTKLRYHDTHGLVRS
jgi:hypothetical protein